MNNEAILVRRVMENDNIENIKLYYPIKLSIPLSYMENNMEAFKVHNTDKYIIRLDERRCNTKISIRSILRGGSYIISMFSGLKNIPSAGHDMFSVSSYLVIELICNMSYLPTFNINRDFLDRIGRKPKTRIGMHITGKVDSSGVAITYMKKDLKKQIKRQISSTYPLLLKTMIKLKNIYIEFE